MTDANALRLAAETAAVLQSYGATAQRVVQAVDAFDIENAGAWLSDQATAIASAFNVDLPDAGALGTSVGMYTAAIEAVAKGLDRWNRRKLDEEREDKSDAQEAILAACAEQALKTGAWCINVFPKGSDGKGGAIVTGDAFYGDISSPGLPGVIARAETVGLEMATTEKQYKNGEEIKAMPCYPPLGNGAAGTDNAGKGKSATGRWRLFVGLFPLIYSRSGVLDISTAAEAMADVPFNMMVQLHGQCFESWQEHLKIDARAVVATLEHFLAWAKPVIDMIPRYGEYSPEQHHVYRRPNGLLVQHGGPRTRVEKGEKVIIEAALPGDDPAPGGQHIPPAPSQAGVNPWRSFTVTAYNHVVSTCARFLAVRAALLRAPQTWSRDMIEAAATNQDPEVKRAVNRAKNRPKGHTTTTTTGGPRPGVVGKKPARAGRGLTLDDIVALAVKPRRGGG